MWEVKKMFVGLGKLLSEYQKVKGLEERQSIEKGKWIKGIKNTQTKWNREIFREEKGLKGKRMRMEERKESKKTVKVTGKMGCEGRVWKKSK